ncbi:MAG: linear amide C-N hydrolase [Desulfarculaceae bacterium]|nr:linear amide C-N hydrolase [Desulfarculaceae bacterium]MCF8049067.1 linear amide C-N hydrolase [Desulfarculaceae bacterium]MCF8066495.1 linear amide C-N hydrolase [Desulfarculaceae bacterium]MCF8098763.1 linear amide C-N hydrolase [Desulfarculaceae bacterium]MCF8123786.1 linear amide C-N hydrolase [Desulfarculaceae bacterium]
MSKPKFLLIAMLAALTALAPQLGSACSEVFLAGPVVSARNFDFMTSLGEIRVYPPGQAKASTYVAKGFSPLRWTSRYGSVAFNLLLPAKNQAYGVERVAAGVDGMNQAGLKVGSYYLFKGRLPAQDARPVLDVADWVQYLLDNFATVGEAVADARSGRYRLASVGTDMVEIKLHLFVHDRGGNSAVLEYLDGKLVVHENPAVRVLTNSPYAQCCAALPSKGSAWKSVPGGAGSLDRFLRGAYYLAHVPPWPRGARRWTPGWLLSRYSPPRR